MTLRINNNIPALNSLRNLAETNQRLAQSLERLSSGFQINKGADSPAGLLISEQMRAQLAGLNQAIANSELDNSMIQTTEGALSEVNSLLIRACHGPREDPPSRRAHHAPRWGRSAKNVPWRRPVPPGA